VWLPRDPSRTRDQILLHAEHQFADGSVYHWWHPLAEFGLRTACSDDYLWLPFLTVQYIKDTGDWPILDATTRFVDDAERATLLEHCKRSIKRSLARQSPRGLPLIGSCDWNDGLSAMGIDGRGESVWLGQWLAVILEEFASIVERGGSAGPEVKLGAAYREARERLIAAINNAAWDGESGGEWYRAATRDDGRWIGTATNQEGRIFLNTQTWAILSGTAPAARADAAWASVKRHLLRSMGPLLSAPAYTEPDPTIGYITRYAPGLRENGGVYMHAATWALAAACKRKDVSAIEQIWRAISPPLRGQDSSAYHAEPYVTPGNVDGPDSATPGRAGWTWYTGSAAWLNRVSLEWVIGMRPEWDGLLIDPAPFPALGKVTASRLYRGRQVRVSFDATQFSSGLPPRIAVNGRTLNGNILRIEDFPGDSDLEVEVSWGVHVNHSPGLSAGATIRRAPQC
jgi:cellobiose phosphorylase